MGEEQSMGASSDEDRAVVNGASALRASIPSADDIPAGDYCYQSISKMNERGFMRIKGMCPYWERREGDHAYCRFLNYETEFSRELLWDQVKVCEVNCDD